MNKIDEIIESAIEVLAREQLPNGGFLNTNGYETTFLASTILSCVNSLGDLDTLRKKAAEFLLDQKSEIYSFNYWARQSVEAEKMPYPDDLDDTFAALIALRGYDPGIIGAKVLGKIAKILSTLEVAPGGPYRTWLVGNKSSAEWRDIDIVVNANVGYFLSGLDIRLPNLEKYLDKSVSDGATMSPYYPGKIQTIYFLSRFYKTSDKQSEKNKLIGYIEVERSHDGFWKNTLEGAMAISAMISLGVPLMVLEKDIDLLLNQINNEGFLPYPFCIDPSRDGVLCYSSSRALTAAFSIEAIASFKTLKSQSHQPSEDATDSAGQSQLKKIKNLAQSRCANLPNGFRESVVAKIENWNLEEAVFIPEMMVEAMECEDIISSPLLDELALANFYGWLAYTIYDDFLDGEGEPRLLPAANFFLRQLANQYSIINKNIPGAYEEFDKLINIVDAANFEEQCQQPILAEKSMGHALPALAIALANGYDYGSSPYSSIFSYFEYYLAARQLHDDAHDWKEDIANGKTTDVTNRLMKLPEADKGKASLDILFWRNVIPEVIEDMKDLLNKARNIIADTSIFPNPAPLEMILTRLERSADLTMRERSQAIEFIDAFTCYN